MIRAPGTYDVVNEGQFRAAVEKADRENIKRGRDIELANDERLILRSPDGSRFYLTVANDGTLTATGL
jgi:hypothetical protein